MYNSYDFQNRNRPVSDIANYNQFANSRNNTTIPISAPQYNVSGMSNNNDALNQGLSALGSAAGQYLANRQASNNNSILPALMSSSGSAISNAVDDYITGGTGNTAGNLGWIEAAQGAGRSADSLLNNGNLSNAGQAFFNINEDDSEIGQAFSGALNGAQMGSAFGPWGAVAGGILGLGSSFLDDI